MFMSFFAKCDHTGKKCIIKTDFYILWIFKNGSNYCMKYNLPMYPISFLKKYPHPYSNGNMKRKEIENVSFPTP